MHDSICLESNGDKRQQQRSDCVCLGARRAVRYSCLPWGVVSWRPRKALILSSPVQVETIMSECLGNPWRLVWQGIKWTYLSLRYRFNHPQALSSLSHKSSLSLPVFLYKDYRQSSHQSSCNSISVSSQSPSWLLCRLVWMLCPRVLRTWLLGSVFQVCSTQSTSFLNNANHWVLQMVTIASRKDTVLAARDIARPLVEQLRAPDCNSPDLRVDLFSHVIYPIAYIAQSLAW